MLHIAGELVNGADTLRKDRLVGTLKRDIEIDLAGFVCTTSTRVSPTTSWWRRAQ